MTAKKKSAEDGGLYRTNAIARYNPEVAEIARSGLKKMRKRFPGARVLVYDRRQSLPFGFAPAEGGAIFSIVSYPRWARFFFLEGMAIEDPEKRLEGADSQVRSIRLDVVGVTGARLGELLALQWKHVDFERRTLRIEQSRWHGELVTTKTVASVRTIPFGDMFAGVLEKHLQNSRHIGPSDPTFCKSDGTPLHPDVMRKDVLYSTLDRSGIPRQLRSSGFHTFRHSAASFVNAQTGNLKLAQKLLGHSNLSTTADIYTHTSVKHSVSPFSSIFQYPSEVRWSGTVNHGRYAIPVSESELDDFWMRLSVGASEFELRSALGVNLEDRLPICHNVADGAQQTHTRRHVRGCAGRQCSPCRFEKLFADVKARFSLNG